MEGFCTANLWRFSSPNQMLKCPGFRFPPPISRVSRGQSTGHHRTRGTGVRGPCQLVGQGYEIVPPFPPYLHTTNNNIAEMILKKLGSLSWTRDRAKPD